MDSRLLGNDIEEKKMQGHDESCPNKDGFDESNPYVIATIISNWPIGESVNWEIGKLFTTDKLTFIILVEGENSYANVK